MSQEDTILKEAPTVTIEGTKYTIRKLGLRDVFRVARILGSGVAVLGDTTGQYAPGQVVQVLVASLARNEEQVLDLIANLIGVKRKDLDDPEKFPMESIIDVFQALAEHQDLKSFFARLSTMTESLPEMQTASRESSNS